MKSTRFPNTSLTTGLISTAALLLTACYANAAPVTERDTTLPQINAEAPAFTDLDIYSGKGLDLVFDDYATAADEDDREKIPEPSSLVLTGVGMTILMLRHKR